MLKSNGLHHSENLPVKFGFSPQIVPANIVKKLPSQRCFKPLLIPIFNFPHKRPTLAFTGKVGTHSPFGKRSHTAAHAPKQGPSERGCYHYPRTVPHVSETLRGQVSERRTLPLLGLGRVYARRTQKAFGTAMRLCASLSRGVAASPGCVIFFASAEVAACTPCAQCFPNVRDEGWYHYPRRALRVLETPDGRLSKRLICRFLRSGGRSSPHDSYFLANTQNFLLAVPVANTFALWYDKFDKLELSN